MEQPSKDLAQSLLEQCPKCQSPTTPVAIERPQPTLVSAIYRCVMCRYDFPSTWVSGWQRQNPTLFDASTSDIFDSPARQPIEPQPRQTDKTCPSCLATLGTPHAMACPYA